MKETELYEPIKRYFVQNGYEIQAEVKNCDVACIKDKRLTIIELKTKFNLKLLYQAMDRKTMADNVYVAIGRPTNFKNKETKNMIKILQKLDIGLITVSLDSKINTVQIIHSPNENKIKQTSRKMGVINEIQKRNIDINVGGSTTKDPVLTAYREKCIYLVCILQVIGTAKPSGIKRQFNIENPSGILRNNYYGYFDKVSRGIYCLSQNGEDMLESNLFNEAINYYKKEVIRCLA